jgi:arylsulfatase A-like enzyme
MLPDACVNCSPAARYVNHDAKQQSGKPFFMYLAYTAAHWPMHAKPADIAKCRGNYDAGYTPIRQARLEKMRELGLLDHGWKLSPQFGDWRSVSRKDWEARCMEVYAAMIDIMATAVDVADGVYPSKRDGRTVQPMEGRSLVPAFTGAERTHALPWPWTPAYGSAESK